MLHRPTTLFLLTGLALAAAATGQIPGTLFGQISDQNGDPVPGVKIVLTNPEAPNFRQEELSDERGDYNIFVANAVPPYNFSFQKEGYQPFTVPLYRIVARKRTRLNLEMTKLQPVSQQVETVVPGTQVDEEAELKGSVVKLYNDGLMAQQAGDHLTAKRFFEEALTRNADYGPAHGGMARVYSHEEKWGLALSHAQKSIELNPDDTDINQVLYASYHGLGRMEEAEAILSEMQAANPERAGKNLFNQAVDLYNDSKIAEAKPIFERVLATDPKNGQAHYMLGMCYINEGEMDKAKEHLNQFVAIAPGDPDAGTAKEMLDWLNSSG